MSPLNKSSILLCTCSSVSSYINLPQLDDSFCSVGVGQGHFGVCCHQEGGLVFHKHILFNNVLLDSIPFSTFIFFI